MARISDTDLIQAVNELQPNAYGVTVHRWLEAHNKNPSLGYIHIRLRHLEDQGRLVSYTEPGGPERGYRDKYLYRTVWSKE